MPAKLLTPHQTVTRLQKTAGIICCLLMSGSLLFFLLTQEILPFPAAAAVCAVLAATLIYFRLHHLFTETSWAVRAVSAVDAGAVTLFFRRSFLIDMPELNLPLFTSVFLALLFGFLLLFSILLHIIGEPHPTVRGLGSALLSTLPLWFTVLIYLPCESYLNNALEFRFIMTDFLPILAERLLVAAVTLPVLIGSMRKPVPQIYRALMCGLFFAVYVQYLCMNRALPGAMGEPVEWSAFRRESVLTGIVWIILLILPFVLPKLLKKNSEKIRRAELLLPCIFGGIEAVTLGILMLTTEYPHNWVVPSGEEQYTVSAGQNIITIVLDEADADLFEAQMQAHPEAFAALHDFTYYSNYTTLYDATVLAIPQMLTSSDILPETTLQKWSNAIFDSPQAKRFFGVLHDNQYVVNLYGDFSYNFNYLTGCADNMTAAERDLVAEPEVIPAFMKRLALYRCLPFALKRFYEVTEGDLPTIIASCETCAKNNTDFISGIAGMQTRQDGKSAFIMQHLKGMHYPYDSGSLENEYLLCAELVSDYIAKLKELGVYDDALIIITSDHGIHDKKGAFPVFLMKEPHRTAKTMEISDAPIALNDYAKTCLIASGLYEPETDDALFPHSVYDFQSGDTRERLWFAREEFDYAGEKLKWTKPLLAGQRNALFGYRFTGDRNELKRVTETEPPSLVLEMDSTY